MKRHCGLPAIGLVVFLTLAVVLCAAPLRGQSSGSAPGPEQTLSRIAKVYGAGGLDRLESWQSAVVISADGLLVTAWSYVLDGGATVVLDDGRRFEAELVGYHPPMELALIRIEATDLPCFQLDRRPPVYPGQTVFAWSNLYGIATGNEPVSVQRGSVSALTRVATRRGPRSTGYQGPALVVDVVVNNPGSAGGAITNRQGELLGVIGRESRDATSQLWLNFAIPVAEVARAVREIRSGQARLAAVSETGLPEEPVTLELLGLLLLPEVVVGTPPWVEQVVRDSPAARAGLRADDLIIEIDGQPVATGNRLRESLTRIDRDRGFAITVQRNGEFVELDVSINR